MVLQTEAFIGENILERENKMKKAIFGPGGNEEKFTKQYKSSLDAPEYLKNMGLDAYEYQCGRGINITEERALELGEKAKEHGIVVYLHSPYFINLSNVDEDRVQKNIKYIVDSCKTVKAMGGERVVVHCGGLSGRTREEAFDNTIINLKKALFAMEECSLDDIKLCIETMGKINVLGTLDEVIKICQIDDRLLPCIDFGHLNSRTHGALDSEAAFGQALECLIDGLGYEKASRMHVHFSRIEYGIGGEVKHLTFDNLDFGPSPELVGLFAKYRLCPTVICESAGTQAQDALTLKKIYLNAGEF